MERAADSCRLAASELFARNCWQRTGGRQVRASVRGRSSASCWAARHSMALDERAAQAEQKAAHKLTGIRPLARRSAHNAL